MKLKLCTVTCTLIALAALFVSLGGNAAVWAVAKNNGTVAKETHNALCALKQDVRKRHDAGVKFLKENPNGIPGISAAQIQTSIDNQNSTLEALKPLDC